MLRWLGKHFAARGMVGPAKLCNSAALLFGRNNRRTLSALLDTARRLDDRHLAIDAAKRLVDIDPRDVSARNILATALLLQGEVEAAEAHATLLRGLLPPGEPVPRVVRDSLIDPARAGSGDAYVAWLDDVLVETAFWSVVKEGRVFNREVYGRNLAASPFVNLRVSPDGSAFLTRCPAPVIHIEAPCVHLGGDHNYSHWVNRCLLKLALIEEHDEYSRLPLLVNDDLLSYQKEYFELLGIGPDRLLRVPRNAVISCRRLAVPTLLRNHPKMHIGTDWLRRRLAPHMVTGSRRQLLFVARRGAARRVIVNEAELAKALASLGFHEIVPSELTVREQIAAFSAAQVVVAAHGAALANLVFAPSDVLVVELSSATTLHMTTFRELAHAIGQRIVTIVSDDYDLTRHENNPQFFDFRIDPEEVIGVLRTESPNIF